GILTELLKDSASVLLPTTRSNLKKTLLHLKVAEILEGYRNQPAANIDALLDACEAIQAYVLANLDTIEEVEVNPLIVTPTRAVAVDALIRKRND
ncbi:MAG TPA: acyl-CoA synthetase, partial [Octadecabacter sp.]|nr:acyl-CoA synthetase [Octadecabacter sp.]